MFNGVRYGALALLALFLGACGGGGGEDSGTGATKANSPPHAVALASGGVIADGDQLAATVGGSVHLDASGSTDPDHDALTFRWTLTAQPDGGNAPATVSASTLDFQPAAVGTYIYSLTVSDNKGGSDTQTIKVTANNRPPVATFVVSAQFTATPMSLPAQAVSVGSNVVLDATGSSDPDGEPVTVTFALEQKPAGSQTSLVLGNKQGRFTPDVQGSYVVRARGVDAAGASFESVYTFTASNRAPTPGITVSAQFVANPTTAVAQQVTVGSIVTLDGSASVDPDGDPVSVTFTLTSKPAASATVLAFGAKTASFTPDMLGRFTVTAHGTDGKGASFDATYVFDASNRAPNPVLVSHVLPVVSNAGAVTVNASVGYDVVLDGSASSDPDGNSVTRAWSMISRPAGSTAALTSGNGSSTGFSPDVLGDYVVQLTVTDSMGAQSTYTTTVRVNNRRPVASITTNATPQSLPSALQFLVPLGTRVTLRGDTSTDADSDVLSYAWSVDARPAGSAANLSSTTAVAPQFTPDAEGVYVFRLRVTDTHSAYSEQTVQLTVGTHTPVAVIDKTSATAITGAALSVSGAMSYDADGDSLSYQWTVDAKPSGSSATLTGSNSANASFTPDVAGVYVLALTISDGRSSSVAYIYVRALDQLQHSVALNFKPIDTQYSVGLDKLVATASLPDSLRIIDPFVGTVASVPLPLASRGLKLSPDGKLAVVLHDTKFSLVDLQTASLIRTSASNGSQTDAFVTNDGFVYLIGGDYSWSRTPVAVFNGRTGTQVPQGDLAGNTHFYGGLYGVFADKLNRVIFGTRDLSPQILNYFTVDSVAHQAASGGIWPYWGDYSVSQQLYLSGDQSAVFMANGNYFYTDSMKFAGHLSGISWLQSFHHSASAQEALALSLTSDMSTSRYPSSYQRFTGSLLLPATDLPLPTVGGSQSYGVQIFHSSADAHVVLVQTGTDVVGQGGASYYVITR